MQIPICLALSQLNLDAPIPSAKRFEGMFGEMSDEEMITQTIPKGQEREARFAARAIHYGWCNHYGAIGTTVDIRKCWDFLLPPFMKTNDGLLYSSFLKYRVKPRYGTYGGQKMYSLGTSGEKVYIKPANALIADVQGKLPAIHVTTRSRTKTAFVLERMLAVYIDTNNALAAWGAGYVAADTINSGEIDCEEIRLRACQCSDDEKDTAVHICHRCLLQSRCADMQLDDNRCRVCSRCTSQPEEAEDAIDRHGSELRISLKQLLRKNPTIPQQRKKEYFKEVLSHLEQFRTAGDR
jgi:hypothetical protein